MNNKKKLHKFATNTFWQYANEYRKNLTDENEIEKIDMTEIFYKELDYMIKNGELVNININGKVRLGKSTQAIAIGMKGFKLLQKYGMKKEADKFTMKNIARDDQEYSKLMRDENTRFTFIVTDENNELEHGGENSSVEAQLQKVFSDVQAGRYVHRISCSPKEIIDHNADIILEIISIDKKRRISHNKLYYRLVHGGSEYVQLLGYVNIDVNELISVWEDKVKKTYFKQKWDKKDKEIIEYWKKKDVYVEYMIKKYEKMQLITKEGIFRPRILDYAEIIIEVTTKLKKLSKISGIINQNIVRNYIKIHAREKKIPLSIIGEEMSSREVMGILDLYKGYNRISKQLVVLKTKYDNGKMTQEEYEINNDTLENMRKELLEAIRIQETELERYKIINEKYNLHLK